MRKIAMLVTCTFLALGGVAAWQLTSGGRAISVETGGASAALIGTSIPVIAATPEPNNSFQQNPDPKDRVTVTEPAIVPKPPQGRPALTPTRPEAPSGQPTFDAAAVEYTLNDQAWQFTFPTTGAVTVASVEFLNGAQLVERGVSAGYKHVPDRLFCVVILAGDFNYPAPLPGSAGPLGQPKKLTSIYVFYDARTGNYIGMGSFGQ